MRESLLVNALGHSAGVLVFGIFLYLLIQDRAARRLRGGLKSMLAASLALAWNLASLIVLGTGESAGAFSEWTVAVGFSVLSLLPAVLFDLSLASRPILVRCGYALSAAAILMHLAELVQKGDALHRAGLTLITVGFGALTAIAALGLWRSGDRTLRAVSSRMIGAMSLFLLAVSFVHLGSGHAQQIWSQELAFHHAAIPLALLVLLQDYRFVLLDAFLRFLANVLLAALVVSGVAAAWNLGWVPAADTPFHQALLLAGACLLLVLFAILRGGVQNLLTRVVFRRPDDAALLSALQLPIRDEDDYLIRAATAIGECMGADATVVRAPALGVAEGGMEAAIPLPIPSGPRQLLLGRRAGGRRYLSEDLQTLNRAASAITERLDEHRETEMRRLMAQAELRALQSQIHPHFLFNSLNALYGIIPREATGARNTVLNLADIFRYFLESKKTQVPLEEELHIVRAYLDIERLRLGDKLAVEFDIAHDARLLPIPILSVQPLVENAVKHGIAPQPRGGVIRIRARVQDNGALRVQIQDTGAGFGERRKGGVGLENVRRRLELGFGGRAELEIQTGAEGSDVSICIPAAAPRPAGVLR